MIPSRRPCGPRVTIEGREGVLSKARDIETALRQVAQHAAHRHASLIIEHGEAGVWETGMFIAEAHADGLMTMLREEILKMLPDTWEVEVVSRPVPQGRREIRCYTRACNGPEWPDLWQ